MNLKSGIGIKAILAFSGILAICSLGMCCVVINEFELSPPDNGTVWVELYNTEDAAVDLTGWMINIADGPWEGHIPLTCSIEPNGFLAVEGQKSWITTGNGTVFLYDTSGIEADKTSQQSDNSHSDFTYGRLLDGKKTNTRADFGFMMASKGRSNVR
jgi:hypothetical protein